MNFIDKESPAAPFPNPSRAVCATSSAVEALPVTCFAAPHQNLKNTPKYPLPWRHPRGFRGLSRGPRRPPEAPWRPLRTLQRHSKSFIKRFQTTFWTISLQKSSQNQKILLKPSKSTKKKIRPWRYNGSAPPRSPPPDPLPRLIEKNIPTGKVQYSE